MTGTLSYVIDDETLRERCDDVEGTLRRIAELERCREAGDGERIAWLRIIGRLDEAETLARAAFARAGGPVVSADSASSAIRLATVLQWGARFDEADALYRGAIEALSAPDAAPATTRRRAFGEQQLGKSLFDQARHGEAADRFREALALRIAGRAPADELASTVQALTAALRRGNGWSDARAELVEGERRLLAPEIRRDRALVEALLDDDFVEIGASGRTRSKVETLLALETEADREPSGPEEWCGAELTGPFALVAYRLAGTRPSRRCSIWTTTTSPRVRFHWGVNLDNRGAAGPSLR